jgi:hypothetical protein
MMWPYVLVALILAGGWVWARGNRRSGTSTPPRGATPPSGVGPSGSQLPQPPVQPLPPQFPIQPQGSASSGQRPADQGSVDGTNLAPLSVDDCERELVKLWGANWKDYLISEGKKFCWRSKNGLRGYITLVEGLCNPKSDPKLRGLGLVGEKDVVKYMEKVDRSEFFFEALYEAQNILSEAALLLTMMGNGAVANPSALEGQLAGLLQRLRPYVGPGLGAYLAKWPHGVYTPYYRQIADRLGIAIEDMSGEEGRRVWIEWLKAKRDAEYPSAPCVGGKV